MELSETADQNDILSSNWRTRDSVQELFAQRDIPIASVDTATSSIAASLSSQFDVETSFARVRRDKAIVVRTAFGAAAVAVVHTLAQAEDEHENDYEENGESSLSQDDLPPLAAQWKQLEEKRSISLKRAHENKEVKKNKVAAVVAPTSDGASTSTKSKLKIKITASDSVNKVKNAADHKTTTDKTTKSSGGITTATSGPSAAVDSRSVASRAVLCTAASIAFDKLTPILENREIDVLDVPQNTARTEGGADNNITPEDAPTSSNSSQNATAPVVNMGAVSLQAKTIGQRASYLAKNAAQRSRHRYDYRRDNAQYEQEKNASNFCLSNPFAWKPENGADDSDEDEGDLIAEQVILPTNDPCDPAKRLTTVWKEKCLPRLSSILGEGSGHAVYCDLDWSTRHGRIANLLQQVAQKEDNYGLHLIVTTHPQVDCFAQEFDASDPHVNNASSSSKLDRLRVLTYAGTASERRKLRGQLDGATGLVDASFHVLVMSYTSFLKDYLHICQIPFQTVILDEGFSWMAVASADPNGSIGNMWDNGVWSSSDQHIGLAGASHHQEWDFSWKEIPEEHIKSACIGLTARHRIITASSMSVRLRDTLHAAPAAYLVNFFLPQFTDVVREEWDRSRIASDPASMDHMRKLLTRSIVVHDPSTNDSLYELAMNAMTGKLSTSIETATDHDVPDVIADEALVMDGKISQSRRFSLAWLGKASHSWLRYELGSASLQPLLNAMKQSSTHGHVCEEVVTASSTTSSGAGGTVSGTQAYRLALRCGRNFGSEQGLRQHMAALHAPPGTWLCRTCGGDCGTSQARTHHERSCGQSAAGAPAGGGAPGASAGGAPSTVGQGVGVGGKSVGPTGTVGKKGKTAGKSSSAGAVGPKDKDKDGSFRVPGYRGVWLNTAGKHFVKIKGVRLTNKGIEGDEKAEDVLLFDAVDDAARKHDEFVSKSSGAKGAELNFRPDGSRIVYEDSTAAAAAGRGLEMLGGGASSVVPALSVINIKDLPPHVRPLLRDPRQTSRTGGNSKRHVYAYRGVCRQARKGHDRWQSQISFGGTNHYLGTFDSEWDAAAIYAWAHLILYGEEATKKAQKEGEEAAEAYEQEKRDIAAGKIIVPPPKAPKKKKEKKPKEPKKDEKGSESSSKAAKKEGDDSKTVRKRASKDPPSVAKKAKVTSPVKNDNASLAPFLSRGVTVAPVLAPRKTFEDMTEDELMKSVSTRILAVRTNGYLVSDAVLPPPVVQELRPCAPVSSSSESFPTGSAMLMGLAADWFGWDAEAFIASCNWDSNEESDSASTLLEEEFGNGGFNESFRTIMQGTMCVIGRAGKSLERASDALGMGPVPLGGTIGDLDCNIGGTPGSCSESSAVIQYSPAGGSEFQFMALSGTEDIVTLNGARITSSMGSFPLFNEDVCSVGSRVFVFLLPTDT
eukprot:CAMPEP_0195307938 /NCGR_PEP_ID=MMETSP0707-20130614/37967_1 /TAXON_ID=33640 /ORGANISM="Asterionellopsis glacialis, Strain CCMP134" /LENGTH=1416 /DNA_ID=CAMNT_0040372193 /DNA_START=37 /DNA_END=4287 /DNA_ORIENTATION=-